MKKEIMNLTGQCSEKRGQQMTKYSFDFSKESIDKNIGRLTNQPWKLIPMRENNENWQKRLNTVILEITGMNEIFYSTPGFYSYYLNLKVCLNQKAYLLTYIEKLYLNLLVYYRS